MPDSAVVAVKTATHRLPGMTLTGRIFTVPLDHARPDGETIDVFAREIAPAGKETEDLPWLVFFQGGPGFASPRPITESGWIKRALKNYRVLLLDQRGTGRSRPVTLESLSRFPDPQAAADYLAHFRADSIVQDAERIRRELVGNDTWSVLGQSFGGFCVTHYLSAAPGGLREAIITGGLPPIGHTIDDIYRATHRRVLDKNAKYYERYPDDAERARAVLDWIARNDVRLPSGDRLTPRRFQQLGIHFGFSDGFETLHYLLEEDPGFALLRGIEHLQSFDTNPLYAIIHEACYCENAASNWAAARVLSEFPDFTLAPDRRVTFTGEMIFPWMFADYRRLAPLRESAALLARFDGWPALYDPAVLRANRVPCVAAIYYDDMYVERAYSEETAAMIPGMKTWITNEYEHNAIRAEGERVLDRLLAMLHGTSMSEITAR